MGTKWVRVLALSMLVMGTLVLSTVAISGHASAASVSGTWVSRISGSGYTQTYMGPSGQITDEIDIRMTLSQSGNVVTGTFTGTSNGEAKTYNVEGTFDGTTFLMTAHYGWDGLEYLNPVYTLTVEGDRMYGSGSYLNVGVTIHGAFDLKKSGLFGGVGGMTPMISAGVIALSIVAIVVAATPLKKLPQGFTPQTPQAKPYQFNYQSSAQTTTEVPNQPNSGEGTQYLGGAGLQYATPPPTGKPFPPREHYANVSQEPPRCPIHGQVALSPHFAGPSDPGSWFCPRCNGYPWGKT